LPLIGPTPLELWYRERDSIDRRRIHLHYAPRAMALAAEYFGPLALLTADVTDQFTDSELDTIARYRTLMADAMHTHRTRMETPVSSATPTEDPPTSHQRP